MAKISGKGYLTVSLDLILKSQWDKKLGFGSIFFFQRDFFYFFKVFLS